MRVALFALLFLYQLFANNVEIETQDGFVIKGELQYPETIGEGETLEMYPLALFLHGLSADRTIWSEFSGALRELGFATLEIDMRGHGESIMQDGKVNRANFPPLDAEKSVSPLGEAAKKIGLQHIPTDIAQFLEVMYETERIDVENLLFVGERLGAVAFVPLLQDYNPKAAILLYGSSLDFFGKNAKDSLSSSKTPMLFVSLEDNLKIGINYLKLSSTLSLLALQERVAPIEIKQLLIAYIRQHFELLEQEK